MKTKDYRKAARLFLLKITMPKIVNRLMHEMDKSKGDDFRILGKVVGFKEKEIFERIESIKTNKEFKQFSSEYNLSTIENCIRVKYIQSIFKQFQNKIVYIESKLPASSNTNTFDDTDNDTVLNVSYDSYNSTGNESSYNNIDNENNSENLSRTTIENSTENVNAINTTNNTPMYVFLSVISMLLVITVIIMINKNGRKKSD